MAEVAHASGAWSFATDFKVFETFNPVERRLRRACKFCFLF
jgi:hypothetical protein